MIICLDFDGTVVDHQYPRIGEDLDAIGWLGTWVELGARIVLWTCRDGDELAAAAAYLRDRGIPLYGVNEHPAHPGVSRKVFANLYIDDRALGVPLRPGPTGKPVVDWSRVGPLVVSLLAERGR